MTLTPNYLIRICTVCLFSLLYNSPPAAAGEIQRADINYSDGRYFLTFDAVLDGRYDVVHKLVRDYAGLHQLSDAVLESVILETPRPGVQRLKFVAQVCILIFCFNKSLVVDVREAPEGVFNATVIPALCDFMSGHGTWRFTAAGPLKTSVHYSGVQEPAFWIPPVIGPYILKHKLVKEAVKTISNVERMAKNA